MKTRPSCGGFSSSRVFKYELLIFPLNLHGDVCLDLSRYKRQKNPYNTDKSKSREDWSRYLIAEVDHARDENESERQDEEYDRSSGLESIHDLGSGKFEETIEDQFVLYFLSNRWAAVLW